MMTPMKSLMLSHFCQFLPGPNVINRGWSWLVICLADHCAIGAVAVGANGYRLADCLGSTIILVIYRR